MSRRVELRSATRIGLCGYLALMALCGVASADPYNLNGYWVEVDYWAGSGSNETIVVIDWNQTNGPYTTEAHAWGYRWNGDKYLADAIADICVAGLLEVTTNYGGAFVDDAFYYDSLIDEDNHTSAGYSGWWWTGETTDGGQTWTGNTGGIDVELLGDGKIEGLNLDFDSWTSDTLTVPVPEPASFMLVIATTALAARRRR